MAIIDAYSELRNRHRHRSTAALLEEAEDLRHVRNRLEWAAIEHPASVRFLEDSRTFLDSLLEPIAQELEERRRMRASPYAPPWPSSWPDRRGEIDEIKASLAIETFVETLTPTRLRRAGRQLVGLCPLHQEKTPSFTVDPRQQLWHCFGCKAGGDVITLAMLWYGVDFPAALTFLAPIAGVERERAVAGRG